MKIKIWFAQYSEEHHIKTLDEVNPLMIKFIEKHGLTSNCWVDFQIIGEFNIKQELRFEQTVEALFG